MPRPPVHFREQGAGPAVVCLHSNASTCCQWRALMERLAPRLRVPVTDPEPVNAAIERFLLRG